MQRATASPSPQWHSRTRAIWTSSGCVSAACMCIKTESTFRSVHTICPRMGRKETRVHETVRAEHVPAGRICAHGEAYKNGRHRRQGNAAGINRISLILVKDNSDRLQVNRLGGNDNLVSQK